MWLVIAILIWNCICKTNHNNDDFVQQYQSNWEIYFWNIFQWLDNIQQRVWPLRGCLFPDRKLPRTDQQVITTRPLAESLQSIDFVSGNVFAFGIEAKVAVPLFFGKHTEKTANKNIYPKCEKINHIFGWYPPTQTYCLINVFLLLLDSPNPSGTILHSKTQKVFVTVDRWMGGWMKHLGRM